MKTFKYNNFFVVSLQSPFGSVEEAAFVNCPDDTPFGYIIDKLVDYKALPSYCRDNGTYDAEGNYRFDSIAPLLHTENLENECETVDDIIDTVEDWFDKCYILEWGSRSKSVKINDSSLAALREELNSRYNYVVMDNDNNPVFTTDNEESAKSAISNYKYKNYVKVKNYTKKGHLV